jgi:DNA-binding MarR family transcriptional regulator
MNLAGGAYLGKLWRKGWTTEKFSPYDWKRSLGYSLSTKGREVLQEAELAQSDELGDG